jgi:aminoglycoside 3-N-acetyltransferase
MIKFTVNSLAHDITSLGIGRGDCVLVRAALRRVGETEGRVGSTVLAALLEVLGEEGTVMGLAFTKEYFLPRIDKKYVFTEASAPLTGGFASAMLEHPRALRSRHPTNSFVAIGKDAFFLLSNHDEDSSCFLPIRNLLTLNGKMMLIGCVSESPGFTTVHLAQEELGLSRRSLLTNLVGVYYRNGSEVRLFKRKDFGGCSLGFYKFYAHYVEKEKLRCGRFGNAYSIAIDARDAFGIELELLRKNKIFPLCDDPECLFCRGSWWYNKGDMFKYYLRYLPRTLKKLIRP